MPLIQELRSPSRKRKREVEAAPIAELESQPLPQAQRPAKRQKPPYPSQSKTPPEFWDKLSRVPLCRRALREFNRRAVQPIAPQPRPERDIEGNLVQQLKRFARRGGPDLRGIRGYPEQEPQVKMSSNSRRSKRSSALDSNTKPTTLSSKDAAFEQELIDNGAYPPGYDDIEPGNLEEISERLGQPRASLSPSKFSREDFLHFRRRNDGATTEAEVMSQVFPIIIGKSNIPSGYNQVFNNLKPLGDHISNAQPDYYNGSRPAEIRAKVRDHLEEYIIPSSQRHRHALPNFFTEAKGPDGKASEAKRQITQDLAVGARGMFMMQSYELDEPTFDDMAHTFGSTYHSGTGTLQLYAMHPTESAEANGRHEYHTTQVTAFALTANPDICRQGIGAYRNLQDLAKERRDEFIACANERADNDDELEVASADTYLTSFISNSQSTQREVFTADSDEESDSTSVDELIMPALPTKRTKVRQLSRKKHKSKISDILVDEDDEQV
ncbi:hypothetical protein P154DRAFT_482175 [Amniculicola lignicola CBS 123094]|uniref:Uncharacterized protein n=1 Tax=Amniculicola lignicola CBS 123094 TaxID=1392246 RepID=A0A6A5WZC7_9PLEO|nr:hypothetical protein P154DRAFT_482175 [Amniculicola lignicola CBS 123094]